MQDVAGLTGQLSQVLPEQSKADIEKIHEFINKHPYVEAVFNDAFAQIHKYFPHANLSVKIMSDPEIVNDARLVIHISPELTLPEALHKEQEFNYAWGLAAERQAKGKLLISVQF